MCSKNNWVMISHHQVGKSPTVPTLILGFDPIRTNRHTWKKCHMMECYIHSIHQSDIFGSCTHLHMIDIKNCPILTPFYKRQVEWLANRFSLQRCTFRWRTSLTSSLILLGWTLLFGVFFPCPSWVHSQYVGLICMVWPNCGISWEYVGNRMEDDGGIAGRAPSLLDHCWTLLTLMQIHWNTR